MENKDLEKLFRNKLESLVMEPSVKARDTFSRDLRSANRRIIIRKISIAAAILLLLSSGTILILQNDRVAKVSLTDKEENRIVNENNSPEEKHMVSVPETENEEERTEEGDQTVDGSSEGHTILDDQKLGTVSATRNENEREAASPVKEERNIPRQTIQASAYTAERDRIQIPAESGNETAVVKAHPNGPGVTVGSYNTTSEEYLTSSSEAGIEQNTRSQTSQHDGDMDPVQSGLEGENRHIEYYIETQGERSEAMITSRDDMKITIEYKASESNKEKSQSRLKEFYSRIDNVKGMDEVIGDIRTYKDRLFTLDFKNREKVNNDK